MFAKEEFNGLQKNQLWSWANKLLKITDSFYVIKARFNRFNKLSKKLHVVNSKTESSLTKFVYIYSIAFDEVF